MSKSRPENVSKFFKCVKVKTSKFDSKSMQGRVEDLDNPSYFWRAHTVTVLLGLIGCLVYTSLIGNYLALWVTDNMSDSNTS